MAAHRLMVWYECADDTDNAPPAQAQAWRFVQICPRSLQQQAESSWFSHCQWVAVMHTPSPCALYTLAVLMQQLEAYMASPSSKLERHAQHVGLSPVVDLHAQTEPTVQEQKRHAQRQCSACNGAKHLCTHMCSSSAVHQRLARCQHARKSCACPGCTGGNT